MSINLKKVDQVKQRTGVSYKAAKDALLAVGGDVLEAIIYLEGSNKHQTYSNMNRPFVETDEEAAAVDESAIVEEETTSVTSAPVDQTEWDEAYQTEPGKVFRSEPKVVKPLYQDVITEQLEDDVEPEVAFQKPTVKADEAEPVRPDYAYGAYYDERDEAKDESSKAKTGKRRPHVSANAGMFSQFIEDIVNFLKDIVHKGNVNRITIDKDGKRIVDLPVTAGAIGVIFFAPATIVSIVAAFATGCDMNIYKEDGGVVNVRDVTVETLETVRQKIDEVRRSDDASNDDDRSNDQK